MSFYFKLYETIKIDTVYNQVEKGIIMKTQKSDVT